MRDGDVPTDFDSVVQAAVERDYANALMRRSEQQQSPPRRRGNKKQATEPTATEVRPWEPAKKKKKREARLHL